MRKIDASTVTADPLDRYAASALRHANRLRDEAGWWPSGEQAAVMVAAAYEAQAAIVDAAV